jgi:hypothetical protein
MLEVAKVTKNDGAAPGVADAVGRAEGVGADACCEDGGGGLHATRAKRATEREVDARSGMAPTLAAVGFAREPASAVLRDSEPSASWPSPSPTPMR